MKKKNKKTFFGRKVFYSVLAATILVIVCLSSVYTIYNNSIEANYEQLHFQTKQYKEDIKLQMESDLENLITMSRVAEQLYANGEDLSLMYNAFEKIGLISEIGVMFPDNTFITKGEQVKLKSTWSFEEEAKKGAYISGKVKAFRNPDKDIIRSSAPVIYNGKTVAIIYGITELGDLLNRYEEKIENIDAQLYVFEATNGELIIDTVNPTLDNISILENRTYRNGHTYNEMKMNIESNQSGYTEYVSRITQEDLYVHYSPIGLSDWYIIIARPAKIVFRNAHETALILFVMFVTLLLVALVYMGLIFKEERIRTNLNNYAASIRKLLLEINQEHTSIDGALKEITSYAKARSVLFADTDGQLFKYAVPRKEKRFNEEEQKYFISQMLDYVRENKKNNNVDITNFEIKVGTKRFDSKFEEFLAKNGIYSVIVTTIVDRSNHTGMIAVLNSKNADMAKALLEKIGVCFSIAIYNRNHLKRTEIAALTDSLTGLSNRTAYNEEAGTLEKLHPKNFGCIFVDVNELHIFNNKNGHIAGDAMLVYIANTLKDIFYGCSIYRMGGDEFLIFSTGLDEQTIVDNIKEAKEKVESMNYHISVGYVYKDVLEEVEDTVKDAEVKMYNDKAMYYQNKELNLSQQNLQCDVKHIKTGIYELDKALDIMSQRYSGIYHVNLKTDEAKRLLMPAYLGYDENEEHFTEHFSRYVNEHVSPDYHRAMISFLNYDAIKTQIKENTVPRITYTKITGEKVMLSVYKLNSDSDDYHNTLWMYENV